MIQEESKIDTSAFEKIDGDKNGEEEKKEDDKFVIVEKSYIDGGA
jgi:hypothetical protein